MKQFFQRIWTKFQLMDRLTKVIFITFIVLALISSVLVFSYVRDFTSTLTLFNLPGAPVIDNSNQSGTAQPQNQQPVEVVTAQPWNGSSRVTILFLGLDYRDYIANDIPRSDTMILFTIDPVTKTAGMLSVPRDLWVNIPNFDFAKINTAYYDGEANHLPGGGPGLAVQTVEQFLGVPINFYIQLDFNDFIRLIDIIGGIKITPTQTVSIKDFNDTYNSQTLVAGQTYSLPGSLAISYARDRESTLGGDFDRNQRQQQVIMAIRDQIIKSGELPGLILKAPGLYKKLAWGIRTNLNITDAIRLGMLAMQIDPNNIKKGVFDYHTMVIQTQANGQDILIPVMDKIRELRDQIFTTGGSAAPIASPNANSTLVRDEAAKIAIQNGTTTPGLAEKTANYLKGQGINVVDVKNQVNGGPTSIYVYNAKPYTVAYLAALMKVAPTNIWNKFDPTLGADIAVLLGNDWAQNNQIPNQ